MKRMFTAFSKLRRRLMTELLMTFSFCLRFLIVLRSKLS